jgi:hypothetical protein
MAFSHYNPVISDENPGKAIHISVAFSNDESEWTEELNVIDCLEKAVIAGGYVIREKSAEWLILDNDLMLHPQIFDFQMLEGRSTLRVSTTIQVCHPTLIPQGLFEYQHCYGDTLNQAIDSGYSSWVKTDLRTLSEALNDQLEFCTSMEMVLPEQGDQDAFTRRIIFGPVSHYVETPVDEQEEHPFCPCCLFTNSIEAFKPLLHRQDFVALRLFASRDSEGQLSADCRINGSDFQEGIEALIEYVKSWPMKGI